MDKKVIKLLYDIKSSVDSIYEYIIDIKNIDEYHDNKLSRRAVEREFEIIGEAMNQIIKIDPAISITYKRRIIDLRNVLIHGYSDISDKMTWSIIRDYLPLLKKEISLLISNSG